MALMPIATLGVERPNGAVGNSVITDPLMGEETLGTGRGAAACTGHTICGSAGLFFWSNVGITLLDKL